jgi:hypothetical protein
MAAMIACVSLVGSADGIAEGSPDGTVVGERDGDAEVDGAEKGASESENDRIADGNSLGTGISIMCVGDAELVGASEGGRLGEAPVGSGVSCLQRGLSGGRTTKMFLLSWDLSVLDLSSLLLVLFFIARPFARVKIFIPRPPFFIFVVIIVLAFDGESCSVPLFGVFLLFFPPVAIPVFLSLKLVFLLTLINAMPPFFPRLFLFVFFNIMPPLRPLVVFASLWTQTWSQLVPLTLSSGHTNSTWRHVMWSLGRTLWPSTTT